MCGQALSRRASVTALRHAGPRLRGRSRVEPVALVASRHRCARRAGGARPRRCVCVRAASAGVSDFEIVKQRPRYAAKLAKFPAGTYRVRFGHVHGDERARVEIDRHRSPRSATSCWLGGGVMCRGPSTFRARASRSGHASARTGRAGTSRATGRPRRVISRDRPIPGVRPRGTQAQAEFHEVTRTGKVGVTPTPERRNRPAPLSGVPWSSASPPSRAARPWSSPRSACMTPPGSGGRTPPPRPPSAS